MIYATLLAGISQAVPAGAGCKYLDSKAARQQGRKRWALLCCCAPIVRWTTDRTVCVPVLLLEPERDPRIGRHADRVHIVHVEVPGHGGRQIVHGRVIPGAQVRHQRSAEADKTPMIKIELGVQEVREKERKKERKRERKNKDREREKEQKKVL